MEFEIDLTGLEGVELALENAMDRVLPAAAKGIRSGSEDIVDTAQDLVPVKSGELLGSIVSIEPEIKDTSVRGGVEATADYALYVELGTGIRGADSELPAGMPEATYTPDWPGQKAQPFLYPAYKANQGKVREAVAEEIRKAVGGE